MQDLNWNDLRFVLAVARRGTLAGAAKSLRVDETTVSRRLARAEEALGLALFLRSEGRLLPTDAGRLTVAVAERSEAALERLHEDLRSHGDAALGRVRLTAVPILVNRVLVPALPRLHRAYPGIAIDLIAEPRDLSLGERDADLALRMARPKREAKVLARRIATLGYGVYARRRLPAAAPWIAYEEAMADLPQAGWIARRAEESGAPLAALRVNDAETLVAGLHAGLGRSLLPIVVGERESGLVREDGPSPALSRELWLLVHPDLRHLARIAAVIAWLDDIFAGDAKVARRNRTGDRSPSPRRP